jgi:hypothetical protein
MPITFSTQDVKLASFPYIGAMVITVHIDRWDVTKILVDNGSQAEILFLTAFDKMGFDRKQLKESTKPLYGLSPKSSLITVAKLKSFPSQPSTKWVLIESSSKNR